MGHHDQPAGIIRPMIDLVILAFVVLLVLIVGARLGHELRTIRGPHRWECSAWTEIEIDGELVTVWARKAGESVGRAAAEADARLWVDSLDGDSKGILWVGAYPVR